MTFNIDQFQALVCREDWNSVYAMLDEARGHAATAEDLWRETYWRGFALEKQQRYDEALDLLRNNAHLFSSQSLLHHEVARLLIRLGRDREALAELSRTPFEAEMSSFYGLAIDAKFFYLYLLAKQGDPTVKNRLSEIPDGYQHIAMDGNLLTKPDIIAVLNEQ